MKSSLGWYVGYNFFCSRDGLRTNTRKVGEETIANKGHNCDVPSRCDTISYCMAGDFRTQNPSEAQTADFTAFVNHMKLTYPDILVIGHRDIGSTSCPAVAQSYIDKFNTDHSDDQQDKADSLPLLQAKLDSARAALARIIAYLNNRA